VALSGDGRLLAVGGTEVSLWDPAAGRRLATLPDCPSEVAAVAINKAGTVVAVPAEDGKVRLWDVAAARFSHTLAGHPPDTLALAFSPDGKTLASGGRDDTVRLWDVGTGKELAAAKGHDNDVLGLAWSPDGQQLASAGQDWVVRLWTSAGKLVAKLDGHDGPVLAVAFSPDGKTLASGGGYLSSYAAVNDRRGVVVLWDVATRRQERSVFAHHGVATGLAYSDDRLLSCGVDGSVKRWGPGLWEDGEAWRGHLDGMYGMAVAGPVLASAGSHGVKLWDVQHPPGRRTVFELNDQLTSPQLSVGPGGKVTDRDGKEWRTGTHEFEIGTVVGVGPDGRSVAIAVGRTTVRLEVPDIRMTTLRSEKHKVVRLIDAETRAVRSSLATEVEAVSRVAPDPAGRFLAVVGVNGEAGRLEVWDTRQPARRLFAADDPAGQFGTVAVAPDGRTVAAVAQGSVVRLWDVPSGTVRATFANVQTVAFAPVGGRMALGATDGSVRFLDVATLGELRASPTRAGAAARSIVFAPDGRTVAVVFGPAGVGLARDSEVWVGSPDPDGGWWKGATTWGEPAFSPDGRTLATFDQTGVTLWQVATGQELLALRPSRYWLGQVQFARDGRSITGIAHHPRDEGTDVIVWPAPASD
jgi:WD40 repeat protein